MHELSFIQGVIATILKHIKHEGATTPGQVKEVILQVGALELHSEEAFRQGFEVSTKDTLLEGAQLQLTVVPPKLKCTHCGFEGMCPGEVDHHTPAPLAACPQCGEPAAVQGGRGVQSLELIMEDGFDHN